MIAHILNHRVTITIGVAFFVFGFFVAANLLRLSDREVMVGLISGGIGGVAMLLASLVEARKSFTA